MQDVQASMRVLSTIFCGGLAEYKSRYHAENLDVGAIAEELASYATANQLNQALLERLDALKALAIARNSEEKTQLREELIAYIEKNCTRYDLTVSSMSAYFNMTVSSLSQKFRKITGMGVLEYITQAKIRKAKVLLETRQYTISQIAELVGYNDASTFIRNFKKVESISPGRYLQELGKEATAEDPHMQWNERRKFNSNSSFRFYIVSNTATQQFCFDCMSFYVDEQNSASRQQVRFDAKAKRGVSEGGTPTLTAEFFASWKDLGYTVDEETGMPEAVYMVPMYRYVEGMDSAGNTFLKPIFAEIDNDRIHNNFAFGKEGYLNADKEDAELGNAGNGFAKSDGWDLSDLDGGEDGVKTVRSTGEHGQAIFFKGINSSRYSYSVDIKINRGTVDDNITAGVCDMKDATQINILRYSGNDYNNNGKTGYRYFLFDFYVTPWHDIQQGVYDGEPGDPSARLIRRVEAGGDVSRYVRSGKSTFGRGGMSAKCGIAVSTAAGGIRVIIADGRRDGVLKGLVAHPESTPHTEFEPAACDGKAL